MSASNGGTPWWYSGDEPEGASDPNEAGPPQDTDGGSRDWTSLVLGAQRIVDWATEKVMAPHSEHGDPREHPDCVVCRTMTVLGEVGLRSPQGPDATPTTDDQGEEADSDSGVPGSEAGVIHWIPIRGEASAP